MRIDNHWERIDKYLRQYHIEDFFDARPLSFFLMHYEQGETVIHPLKRTEYLQFVVEGTIEIYHIREDGSAYTLASGNQLTLLGDMEFVLMNEPVFFAEAKSSVTTVCLRLEENRQRLQDDLIFLNYLLQSLASKVTMISTGQAAFASLEEKILHYIQRQGPWQRLEHIEKTASYLHCSRRQLQRVLKQMVDDGKLVKVKKGVYEIGK